MRGYAAKLLDVTWTYSHQGYWFVTTATEPVDKLTLVDHWISGPLPDQGD